MQNWINKLTSNTPAADSSNSGDIFATTRWTMVIAAGQGRTPQARRALEELCQAYWFPLYAYIRRRGHGKEDAEDLTQAFFARFLEKNYLDGLNAEHGRFRAFLLASLKHFLANERDRTQRQKRGGQVVHLSLNWHHADTRFQSVASAEPTPDQAFDREWAVTLLAQVLSRLNQECAAEGKQRLFDKLKPFLMLGKGAIPYTEAANDLNVSEGAVRVAAHRMRKRYRELLREEIAQTLAQPKLIEEEMKALLLAFVR